MKKFVFTLHSLLHLKESIEKQERNNLAVATRRLHQLQAEREEMVRRRDAAAATYGARLQEGMPVSDTRRFTNFFRMMKETIEEQDERIARALEEVEACRKRLVEVLREIRTLEKLRERQYEQYLREVRAEEERMIGDFVSFQTGRNPRDGRFSEPAT